MLFKYLKKMFLKGKILKEYQAINKLQQKRQFVEAVKAAEKIIEKSPRKQRPYHMILHMCLFGLKDLDKFDYWYSRYITDSKGSHRALYSLMKKRVSGDMLGWHNDITKLRGKLTNPNRARNEFLLLKVLEVFPLEEILTKVDHLFEQSNVIHDEVGVLEEVKKALKQKEGFYYTRMSDGEGSLIAAYENYTADTTINNQVYQRMNKLMFRQKKLTKADLDYIMPPLKNAFVNASLLSIPPASRIKSTLKGVWRGYLGVASCIHFLYEHSRLSSPPALVAHHLKTRIETPEFLNQILALHTDIGLITCHENLADRFKEMGAQSVKVHLIPNQPNSYHGHNSLKGQRLYPDRDQQILREIRQGGRQRIYFVAAGVLAKNYCYELAKAGHIAFDLGSAIDAWMGIAARGQSNDYIKKLTL